MLPLYYFSLPWFVDDCVKLPETVYPHLILKYSCYKPWHTFCSYLCITSLSLSWFVDDCVKLSEKVYPHLILKYSCYTPWHTFCSELCITSLSLGLWMTASNCLKLCMLTQYVSIVVINHGILSVATSV